MSWKDYLDEDRLRPTTRVRTNDPRNEFESDYGRVIFSPAIRRLHDKTQVMPLTTDDNIHSRLTHSLEVLAVAYSLGIRLSQNKQFLSKTSQKTEELVRSIPLILQSAALVHDIGNPPFGHFGEESIKSFFRSYFKNHKSRLSRRQKEDFTHFDGNAQGFRILTKLQVLDDTYGLNLTKATLAAYMKYPNSRNIVRNKIGQRKRGVFQSEAAYLEKIVTDCGLKKNGAIVRHPLSFLVEAADNICYRAMDIEDGFNKGWYTFNDIVSDLEKSDVGEELKDINREKTSASSKIAKFRLLVIGKLSEMSINRFVDNLEKIEEGVYCKELVEDGSDLDNSLKIFCKKRIFSNREIVSLELTGDAVIKGLLTKYTSLLLGHDKAYRLRAEPMVSKSILKVALMEKGLNPELSGFVDLDEYYKLRVIVDYIAGMTDQFALTQYQRLNGQKII
ncbi:dGTP triphosphohydrolase [Alkalispirochaeta alkalica]|uniref:dGTP triphosphohydrolase n=1 Tax=Alkalispirochaeta alkalica TaxID=46356 RepID=UPI00037D4FC6|nr:dNTP triphosphohydrolase [Alkalispirochaeta alkalica]